MGTLLDDVVYPPFLDDKRNDPSKDKESWQNTRHRISELNHMRVCQCLEYAFDAGENHIEGGDTIVIPVNKAIEKCQIFRRIERLFSKA